MMALQFVLEASNHLRTTARNMSLIKRWLPDNINIQPSWYSVRLWVMRLGYYELTREKVKADDWVWIIDHSIQLGTEKALVIVGFRLSEYGNRRGALRHRDLNLISLDVIQQSNGSIVQGQLQKAVEKTGVPRAIIHDNGSDLKVGVREFKKIHKTTASLYDIKHKVAIEIKHQLKTDAQWKAFNETASQIGQRLKQTKYAHLTPPKLRNKARYMNLDKRVNWGSKMLCLLEQAEGKASKALTTQIGELKNYRQDIERWQELLTLTGNAENFCRTEWLSYECDRKFSQQLDTEITLKYEANKRVRQHLIDFIKEQSSACRKDEYLPNSSEVLESLFGRQKYLEGDQQSKSGFTGLLQGIGAFVCDLSESFIVTALETVSVKQVIQWKTDFLGTTLQARRQQIMEQNLTE